MTLWGKGLFKGCLEKAGAGEGEWGSGSGVRNSFGHLLRGNQDLFPGLEALTSV